MIKGQKVCRDLEELERVMRKSQDPHALLDAWVDWRSVAKPMRPLYTELVTLANRGARSLHFKDLGDLWRSQYDMPPRKFEGEMLRLWAQVRPLYQALHCHVRATLNERFGAHLVPLDQPIPAHLLGNMWAQDWSHLYPLLTPAPQQSSLDITSQLQAKGYTSRSLTLRLGGR